MKNLYLIVGLLIASQVSVQPIPVQGAGRGGGGGMAGGAGISMGRSFAPAQNMRMGGRGGSFDFDRGRIGRFDRGRFFNNGGWGYGYPYYDDGYAYPAATDTQAAVQGEEELLEDQRYKETLSEQDRKRIELPTSAIVKNYSWPSDQSTQTTLPTKQSVATSKPVRKAM